MRIAAGPDDAYARATLTMCSGSTPVIAAAASGVQRASSSRTFTKPGVAATTLPSASVTAHVPAIAGRTPSG